MSQHTLVTKTATGKPVDVVMGWDRPLQVFFLQVQDLADDEGETWLYHNLDDIRTMKSGRDFDYFEQKLTELGITIPATMAAEIKLDRENNVGNRYVVHQPE